jgi:hypothetical protein
MSPPTTPQPPSNVIVPDKGTTIIFCLLLLMGALGGAAAYFLACEAKILTFSFSAFFLHAFLGCLAPIIGIFLSNTNLSLRTAQDYLRFLAFCLLCGMSWRPLFDSGALYGKSILAQQHDQSVTKNIISAKFSPTATNQLALGKSLSGLLRTSSGPLSAKVRDSIDFSLSSGIAVLTSNSLQSAKPGGISALVDLARTASDAGQANVVTDVEHSLKYVEMATTHPQVRDEAVKALMQVSAY